jgi:hypothetical protein
MAVESPPWALQAGSYPAEQTRRAVFMWAARTAANTPGILQGGLASATDCQVSAPVSGLSVNVSTGEMLIPGNEGGTQGGAYARVSSTTNAVVSTANPTNPRIDRIVALMSDAGYTEPTGGSGSQWAISVVTGTATAGASLANLSGAAAVPGSSLLLANLLVPAAASNIITADIANVATPAWSGVGAGNKEWAYSTLTTTVVVTSTTESSGNTLVSAPAFTPDGQSVMVEFFAPIVFAPSVQGGTVTIALFEGATEISRLGQVVNPVGGVADMCVPVCCRYKFTPTAAAHTYTVTAFASTTTGTPEVVGGPGGGTGANPPAFVRFTKA